MVTAQGCARRRERLWEAAQDRCEAIVVASPESLTWLSAFWPSPFTFRANEAIAILILEPGRTTLVADRMQQPAIAGAFADEAIAPVWYDGKRSAPHRGELVVAAAVEHLRALGVHRLGIEGSKVPTALVHGLWHNGSGPEPVDLDATIRRLRRNKEPDEIETLKRSARAGEAGHRVALDELKPGMSELEVFSLVQHAVTQATAEPVHLYGDFEAHPRPEDTPLISAGQVLQSGGVFILDFSVIIHGYRLDFANTIAIGSPSEQVRKRAAGCIAAIGAGEALLKPGARCRDIDAAVRSALGAQGLDPNFASHSGHGLGLGHPEPPYIVPESDDVLEAGDVVTLEPGQYNSPLPMRYEHNYLITPHGFERLTNHALALRP